MNLAENIGADPPLPVADAITLVADRKKEWQLPDTELIKVRAPPLPRVAMALGLRAELELQLAGASKASIVPCPEANEPAGGRQQCVGGCQSRAGMPGLCWLEDVQG